MSIIGQFDRRCNIYPCPEIACLSLNAWTFTRCCRSHHCLVPPGSASSTALNDPLCLPHFLSYRLLSKPLPILPPPSRDSQTSGDRPIRPKSLEHILSNPYFTPPEQCLPTAGRVRSPEALLSSTDLPKIHRPSPSFCNVQRLDVLKSSFLPTIGCLLSYLGFLLPARTRLASYWTTLMRIHDLFLFL